MQITDFVFVAFRDIGNTADGALWPEFVIAAITPGDALTGLVRRGGFSTVARGCVACRARPGPSEKVHDCGVSKICSFPRSRTFPGQSPLMAALRLLVGSRVVLKKHSDAWHIRSMLITFLRDNRYRLDCVRWPFLWIRRCCGDPRSGQCPTRVNLIPVSGL